MAFTEMRIWKCANCRTKASTSDTDSNATLQDNCPECGAHHPWYLDKDIRSGLEAKSEGRDLTAVKYGRTDYWQQFSVDGPTWRDKGMVDL